MVQKYSFITTARLFYISKLLKYKINNTNDLNYKYELRNQRNIIEALLKDKCNKMIEELQTSEDFNDE